MARPHAEQHRAGSGNALRAAVLGANDGLVSDLSLVMGVAGASLGSTQILITGLAGLVAGAFSMAMGEWISVTSARELYARELRIEGRELRDMPEAEHAELAEIYRRKGLDAELADRVATALSASPETALDTHAREELGIDPDELGGSALQAAVASFGLFCIGAIPPVAPFAFLDGDTAVAVSLALSCVALFGIGAAITRLTGRSPWYSGARQLAFGVGAAVVSYAIGVLIGSIV
ncbi:VIT1/CCC1 transporter family protein [Capillimicrobium parvum]|uniref:VIT family protein n=1 Tax=Capillimicrobium parvum TaxID=2884022 RepID=A0A9E6Y4E9_9ACTN|nr:VIT1/CCC1 transporter family protein [Capillimicrobium parvum]UGS39205.1 hypothetical protein DSM104329_05637 [Capillimicrobium parvum]